MIIAINSQTCRFVKHLFNGSHRKLAIPNFVPSRGILAVERAPQILLSNRHAIPIFSNLTIVPVHTSSDNSTSDRKIQPGYSKSTDSVETPSGRNKARSIMELMRWHKPTGTFLALAPSLWAVGLVTPETLACPDLGTVSIFTAGAIVARGMGCTLNDILDRKYDSQVERTKMRPIACGDISTKEALGYLAVQSVVGLYVLCLNNLAVVKLGLFSGIMIASYPLFKRFTYWPQAMLALTMNWGVPMGYAAILGSIGLCDLTTLLPIYFGAIAWTLYYDTIYAHQDKTDDIFIGVKSSALVLGTSGTRKFLNLMAGGMSTSLATAGYMTGQMWPYYLSIASTALYHARQVKCLNLDDTSDCWKAFDEQKYVGLTIMIGILVSVAIKAKDNKVEDIS